MIAHDNKKARHFAGFVFFCCLVIFTDGLFDILDLNSYCISRPAATFFLHASSESMNQAGVQSQSTPDRSLKPYGFFTLISPPVLGEGLRCFLLTSEQAKSPVIDILTVYI